MTDEQYNSLTETLTIIRDNQKIINQNLSGLEQRITAKIDRLQQDMGTSLNNDQAIETYFQTVLEELRKIKRAVNS